MSTYTVNVNVSGPLFDGRAHAVVEDTLSEMVWEVAKAGRGMLGVQYLRVFKEPTGYYESKTEAQKVAPNLARIHDSNVVYGPWLEGVGSRNFPVTRFKGYHSFLLVTQELQRKTPEICERILARRIGAMR